MDDAATRLIVTRSNPNQPAQTYLADPAGKRIAWVNENAVKPGHPYYPYLAASQAAHVRDDQGGRRHDAPLRDDHARRSSRASATRCSSSITAARTARRSRATGQSPLRAVSSSTAAISSSRSTIADRPIAARRSRTRSIARWAAVEVAGPAGRARNGSRRSRFVDPDRIATYGWSYGGYMTLKMLEANPGVYAAGVRARR